MVLLHQIVYLALIIIETLLMTVFVLMAILNKVNLWQFVENVIINAVLVVKIVLIAYLAATKREIAVIVNVFAYQAIMIKRIKLLNV